MKPSGAFSVVIPTYNRIPFLDTCVRGIAASDFPRDQLQIVVVNDGGDEIPLSLVQDWKQRLNLCVVTQPNRGPAAARNFGVRHAQHNWVAFTDDDCVPAPDWLKHLGEALTTNPTAVVGGETVNGLSENVYAEASQTLVLFLMDYYYRVSDTASLLAFFPANNFALARGTFEQLGGFDAAMRYAEDRDFCARAAAAGFAFRYVASARVVHARAMNFWSFCRQHWAYGQGAFQYLERRTRADAKGLRLESLSFYAQMLGFPFKHRSPRAVLVAVLVVVSQIANGLGFLQAAIDAQFGSRA